MNNKIKTIFLAVLGGVDVTIHMVTPIILALLWVNAGGYKGFTSFVFYGAGLLATLFRAIKIGWLKE